MIAQTNNAIISSFIKIDYKFKIISITNNEDLEIVKQTLKNIQEQLTTWALTKKSKINFIFKIE